ncbi:MAG: carboxylate-amine ligase [Hyphomicrobiales bacterium]|nr:carboxylate-amine ligase [Hyphomicrobiales bacterium]
MSDAPLLAELATPASAEERARFERLQTRLARTFERIFTDPAAPRSVLIIPSLSLDQEVMSRISGVHHYEERMLCLLLLLRMPRTRVIYVTSTRIPDTIIDYYLHLLPGVPGLHARHRLTLISCDDASAAPLTRKILARPRVLQRIRDAIPDPASAHMTCFTVSELERKLALSLDLPIYGCDPSLLHWGSKSGSRRIFREAGIDMPLGFEDLADAGDVARALAELKQRKPDLRRAVVKLNEGFSGEGNAMLDLAGAPAGTALLPWLEARLPRLAFEARGMTWELYQDKLAAMGGIVEEFIPGTVKRSPSAQLRIDPTGRVEAVSTHDQVLGGANGQIFLGCRFPAAVAYRLDIQQRGLAVARALAGKGVLGRFGIDFISVQEGTSWRQVAIEINLRKGGTTHPFLMLQFLTDGRYDIESGEFLTPGGDPRYYYASDNLEAERYRGLTPYDLVDIAVMNGLHFHAATGEGVAFHLIGALSEFGKLGVVCIGQTPERADALHQQTVAVLDRECPPDGATS